VLTTSAAFKKHSKIDTGSTTLIMMEAPFSVRDGQFLQDHSPTYRPEVYDVGEINAERYYYAVLQARLLFTPVLKSSLIASPGRGRHSKQRHGAREKV
jgi:hypothetical protein